ncbi:hypothetical protein HMPREF0127_00954, partial [Bacteroides sp. 1_1_30]
FFYMIIGRSQDFKNKGLEQLQELQDRKRTRIGL